MIPYPALKRKYGEGETKEIKKIKRNQPPHICITVNNVLQNTDKKIKQTEYPFSTGDPLREDYCPHIIQMKKSGPFVKLLF